MKNDKTLHKWVNNQLSPDELKAFKTRPEYESLVDLYKKTEGLSVPDFDENEMLNTILAQPKNKGQLRHLPRRRFLLTGLKYAAAGAVLLLIAVFLWPNSQTIELTAMNGMKKEGQLPDGSTFVLNAGSVLSYNKDTWDTERNVQLQGEAFFNVKKGKAFTVYTNNGQVAVLGTSFNVKSRQKQLEVMCFTGKVAVSSPNDRTKAVLSPNESIQVLAGQLSKKEKLTTDVQPSWIEGVSTFKHVPLMTVLEELQRQYDIRIDAEQINTTEVVSCSFEHNNLNLALKTSLSALGIRYEIQNDREVVLSLE